MIVILALIFYVIYTFIVQHLWQTIVAAVIIIGSFIYFLVKFPRFRQWIKDRFNNRQTTEKESSIKVPQINQSEKNELMSRVHNRCEYCGDHYTLDVHHIIERSQGGSNSYNNLIVLCAKCHRMAHGGGISKARLQGIARHRKHF
ncbi:MAG: HNH endonuclease [Nanoarchaeota archaeon]|nr:HNH endonuclease [Nanoarchaeota archaeon]